jgi:hypothetical protein
MDRSPQARIRTFAARAIGRDTYPDPAWEVLLARGHVRDLLEGRIVEGRFVDYAKALAFYGDLIEHAEAPSESEDEERDFEPPLVGGYEEQRARTFAEYLELQVAAHPRVLEWRKNSWSSTQPASPEGAYAVMEDARRRDYLSGLKDVDHNETEPSGYLPFFFREPGRVEHVAFYEGSHFERLRDLSRSLQRELFPLWTEPEAAWAVVTGEVREVPKCLEGEADSFSNDHLTHGSITLRVEPWIAADTVTRTYQYLQSLMLRRRPRALSERNLAMTRFVIRQLRDLITRGLNAEEELTKMSWRSVMGEWNEAYPEWAYDDERQFYRDCRRIARAVARPYDERGLRGRFPDHLPNVSIP